VVSLPPGGFAHPHNPPTQPQTPTLWTLPNTDSLPHSANKRNYNDRSMRDQTDKVRTGNPERCLLQSRWVRVP